MEISLSGRRRTVADLHTGLLERGDNTAVFVSTGDYVNALSHFQGGRLAPMTGVTSNLFREKWGVVGLFGQGGMCFGKQEWAWDHTGQNYVLWCVAALRVSCNVLGISFRKGTCGAGKDGKQNDQRPCKENFHTFVVF